MVSLHRRTFVIAVAGAAVFALCTVASSIAVQWVTDHVIVPRFEEGSVAAGTVAAGVGLIIGIGLLRATGVVIRRTWAGTTQWRVAGTLGQGVVDRLVRQPMSWYDRRPDGDLVARVGVDTDAAVSVLAPVPFATGTVLLIIVSAVVPPRHRPRPRGRRRRRVPAAHRPQRHLPEARRRVLRDGAGAPRRARRQASTRASTASSSSRPTAPKLARPSGWRRWPATCARPGSVPSACAGRSRRCSTCSRR